MKQGNRIPRLLASFDQYIRTVIAFLLAGSPNNGSRLGLTVGEVAQAQGFLTLWYTGDPANPGAYELHSNPNTKTKGTRRQVIKIIKDFSAFFGPLLVRISGSASINNSDRLALDIAAPNVSRTRHRTPIEDVVYFIVVPLGGGDMRNICRTRHDSKRASKAKNADSVQLAFKIGDPAPVNADDKTAQREIFTRASFTIHSGSANVGQKLYVFARWYHTKHPELAGPWSGMLSVIIA